MILDYNDALQLMQKSSSFTAYQLFSQSGDYKNSKEQAEKCRTRYRFHETVSAGADHTFGLKKDGTVVIAGDKTYREAYKRENIIAISTGRGHTVGLKKMERRQDTTQF